MIPRRGYMPKDSIFPFVGLKTKEPSTQLPNGGSPNCLNVLFTKGIVSKRRGYVYIGATVSDPVIGITEYESLTGVKTLLAFTTKKQYKYDASSDAWVNITYQSAGVDVNWTGNETNQIDIAHVAGLDGSGNYKKWVIITNGKDQPRYWDGAASKFALYSPTGITDFKTCATITSFYDHVIMGNITYTTGVNEPTNVVWSDVTKLLDFDANSAGAAILSDVQGSIKKFLQLGDRLFIYSDNTIHSITYVAGVSIFTFERILQDTRLVSSRSVTSVGPFHLFLSQENVVMFDGTKIIRTIGDDIYRVYRDEFYASNKHFSFAFNDVARQQVYFNYALDATSAQMYQFEYDLSNTNQNVWTRTKYSTRASSMGLYSRDVNLLYNSTQIIGLKYSGAEFPYLQGSIKGAFPVRVIGMSDGRVALADDTVPNDATVAFDSYIDTMDFTSSEGFQSVVARWDEIECDMRGFECDLYYSTDEGVTYTFIENLQLQNEWKHYKIPFDVSSSTIRIRFRNNCPNSSFYLRWGRIWGRPGGPNA